MKKSLSGWQLRSYAGLRPPAPCSRHPVGQQEVHEYEALRGGSGRRLYCWLTSFSQSLQTNFRITLDGTLTPHLSGAAVTQQPSIMISRILRSVASIPSFAIRQKLSIVFSYCSFTNPSPGRNTQPRLAISDPINPASIELDILAAQDDFAPSHTIPPTFPCVLVMIIPSTSASAP